MYNPFRTPTPSFANDPSMSAKSARTVVSLHSHNGEVILVGRRYAHKTDQGKDKASLPMTAVVIVCKGQTLRQAVAILWASDPARNVNSVQFDGLKTACEELREEFKQHKYDMAAEPGGCFRERLAPWEQATLAPLTAADAAQVDSLMRKFDWDGEKSSEW